MLETYTHSVINASGLFLTICVILTPKGVLTLPGHILIRVEDEPYYHLYQHGQVQLPMNAFLFGP